MRKQLRSAPFSKLEINAVSFDDWDNWIFIHGRVVCGELSFIHRNSRAVLVNHVCFKFTRAKEFKMRSMALCTQNIFSRARNLRKSK